MVDTKISALDAIALIAGEDLFAAVNDPSGTPDTQKATITQLATFLDSATQTFTNKSIDQDGTGNNITNLANASIKAAAGIVYSKLSFSADIVLADIAPAAKTENLSVAVSDETTALTTGTAKSTFRMPYAFTLTDIRASLTTAPTTSGLFTVDVNDGGTSIMTTNKLTIDLTETTTETAATAPVLTDTALANDAEITIDIDVISGGATEAGLKVYLIGYQT